jgi:hypothetical protein
MTTRTVAPTSKATAMSQIVADPQIRALLAADNLAQITTWMNANVTDLPSARLVLAKLAAALVYVWNHR